jgi:hypothetical protein
MNGGGMLAFSGGNRVKSTQNAQSTPIPDMISLRQTPYKKEGDACPHALPSF